MKSKKVIQVCGSDCEKNEFSTKVGNKTSIFCCKKGFEKSLKDFSQSIAGEQSDNKMSFEEEMYWDDPVNW